MSEDQARLMSVNEGDPGDIPIEWRDVPTVLVDSVVGYVTVANLPRVTLGQISFRPGGEHPVYLPQMTIASTIPALKFMAAQLLEIARQAEAAALTAGENAPSE